MLAPFGHQRSSGSEPCILDERAKLAAPNLLATTSAHPSSTAGLSDYTFLDQTSQIIISSPSDDEAKISSLSNDLIQEGSQVILFSTRDDVHSIIVQRGLIFDNKHGNFHHDDMIGLPYGSRVIDRRSQCGWMFLLRPSPQLWTLACDHRTEIIYHNDISLILSRMDIKPGSVIVESGTGSGSLTTSFVAAVQPYGRVYTFEYHAGRAQAAQDDFLKNGLSPWVICQERNTIQDGFPSQLYGQIDALFLDLPSPWILVPQARQLLKPNGWFASFSPCIEQIQETANVLRSTEFIQLEIFETLLRAYDVRSIYIERDKNMYMTSKDKEKDLLQEKDDLDYSSLEKQGQDEDSKSSSFKLSENQRRVNRRLKSSKISHIQARQNYDSTRCKLVARPFPEMRGHTGYLIFARQSANQNGYLLQGETDESLMSSSSFK